MYMRGERILHRAELETGKYDNSSCTSEEDAHVDTH